MSFVGATLLVAGFIALIKIFGLFEKSSEAIAVAKLAYADFRNPHLSDDAKEAALQGYAKNLFLLFFLITLGSVAALGLPIGLLWLLEQVNILSLSAVMATTLSWQFLLLSTILATVIFWVIRKR